MSREMTVKLSRKTCFLGNCVNVFHGTDISGCLACYRKLSYKFRIGDKSFRGAGAFDS